MQRLFIVFLLLIARPMLALGQVDDPMNPWLRRALQSELHGEERWRVQVDNLYWWLDKLPVPPLVTTGPVGSQAIVGEPGTQILRGGKLTSRHVRYTGVRISADAWFTANSPVGLHASTTFLERDSSHVTYKPNTITPLARPYRDPNGDWQSFIIAGDSTEYGPLNGSINVYSRLELFHEDVNLLFRLGRGANYRLNLLVGAHFIQMRERLDLKSASWVLPDETTVIGIADHFQTFDRFYGGQLGLMGELRRGRWFLAGKGSLALGATHQIFRAKGERIIHTPEGRTTTPFGLYALPSNIGGIERTVLDLVSEWDVSVGWSLTSHLRLRAGYTLLTWNNTLRPGDQVEPLNLSQISPGGLVGPMTPRVPFRNDFFWAQGIHTGLEVRW